MLRVLLVSTYILRKLNPELWAQFREHTQRDGWPLRAALLALIQAYLDGRISLGKFSG